MKKVRIYKAPKKFILINTNEGYKKTEKLEKKICETWNKKICENKNLFNGKMFNIKEVNYYDEIVEIKLNISDYAHYLYTEENRNEIDICRSIASIALLKTIDDYYVIGEMSKYTNYSGLYQCPAGSVDIEDCDNSKKNVIDPLKTILREVKEEVGIDVKKEKSECKYFIVRENSSFLGLIYEIKTNLTREKIENLFLQNDNKEFKRIIFIKNNKKDIKEFIYKNSTKLVDYLDKIILNENNNFNNFSKSAFDYFEKGKI